MSFDWKEYVYLAEDLLNRPKESCLRSSISRAYYGVFCLARDKKGYKEHKEKDVHGKVIKKYKDSPNESEQEIGRVLDRLRKERNHADYNGDKIIKKEDAERGIRRANDILIKMKNTL